MEEQLIICEKPKEGVSVITLNRPKVRNALNSELRQQMADLFIQLNDDPHTKAIVLTGGDKVFAAGADINDFLTTGTADMYLRRSERFDAHHCRAHHRGCQWRLAVAVSWPCMLTSSSRQSANLGSPRSK